MAGIYRGHAEVAHNVTNEKFNNKTKKKKSWSRKIKVLGKLKRKWNTFTLHNVIKKGMGQIQGAGWL